MRKYCAILDSDVKSFGKDNNIVANTRQTLPVGALVQWGERKPCGVITANDGQKITVRWDDDARHPTNFSAEDTPLSRVDIAGKTVQRDNGQYVVALSLTGSDIPMWTCSALSASGIPTTVNVP